MRLQVETRMFDANRLLGVLLKTASPGSGADRLERLATVCAPPQPGLAEAPARFAPQEVAVGTVIDNERASVMLRAMIQAVKAGGRSEAEHRQRIIARLDEAGAEPAARQFVIDEMARPLDLDALVAAVRSQTMAVQVYAASLFAIAVETPAEASYLRRLGERLGLDPAFTRELHRSLGIAPAA
jgi:uncharacterized membrane protein YebE (DUF533 family)